MAGPLIGRADELQAVLALVADPGVRAVVLAGPSGVGKTKLALAALEASGLGHRVVVPLSSVREGEVMADAVVAALGASDALAERPAQTLWRSFAGEPVLLLLDNLEQVSGAADVVLALLEGYPEARVLATSLGELGVPGERVVRLGPLPVGGDRRRGQPAALQMFVERALTRDVTHPPSEADLRAAEEICRAVGGLPLAIELAAARAGSMPLALMAAQLSEPTGLRLLDRAPAGSPERHRSLFAALAWTVDLLPPPAAELLAAMSVFEGPTTLEGIASVAPSRRDGARPPLDPARRLPRRRRRR